MIRLSLVFLTIVTLDRGFAQTSETLSSKHDLTDQFISTIALLKRSVAPVVCLEEHGDDASIHEVLGSALFVSVHDEFITAGHVIQTMDDTKSTCAVTAILLPWGAWRPETLDKPFVWFPFKSKDCKMNTAADVSRCRATDDLALPIFSKFGIAPARFNCSQQPDGTQVAFTGFPLNIRDPFTSRAGIAVSRNLVQEGHLVSELILDHTAWPGGSGSPVYLSDGRVIGLIVSKGIDQGTGIAIVRPCESFREILSDH